MRIEVSSGQSRDALITAYLERRADLVRAFTGRLGSRARAEDVVQAMYERIATVSPDGPIANPLAYLFRLGSNLVLDEMRQTRRTAVRERAWSDLEGIQVGRLRATDAPSPERAAEAREALRRLMAAVETLPPQARRAFTLHKLEGLSYAETAEVMAISRSAVEKHMSLALRLLAERTDLR